MALETSFATKHKWFRRLAGILLFAFVVSVLTGGPKAIANTSLPKANLVKPGQGLLGVVDATPLAKDWAKYYGSGLAFTHAYVAAGSTFTLTWKATDANGKPLANYPVTLQANKAWGGNTATFAANCASISHADNSKDGGQLFATTNARGFASFVITNQDLLGEPATTSTTSVDTNSKPVYGQFTLQIGALTDLQQSKEIVEIHVLGNASSLTDPGCTNWMPPQSEYVKSTPVASNSSNASKPRIANHTLGTLIWSDEFSAKLNSSPNSSVWTSRYCGTSNRNGGGIYCSGDQYYTPTANRTDGHGHVVITTTRTAGSTAKLGDCQAASCPFTSGRFDSQGKLAVKYGYLEVRAQMPAGGGQNPAFWLLGDNITRVGWPTSGEIDVLEQPLIGLNQNAGSLHYSTTAGGCCSNLRSFTKTFSFDSPLAEKFHTYGINWSPGLVEFYFDGSLYGSLKKQDAATNFWPFDAPHFLIFDNSTPGDKASMNWNSSQMIIDYVRLWKSDGLGSAYTH